MWEKEIEKIKKNLSVGDTKKTNRQVMMRSVDLLQK